MNWFDAESTWRTQGIMWHAVRLHPDDVGLGKEISDWLEVNVGARGFNWIYPESLTLCFRDPSHATQFALLFT